MSKIKLELTADEVNFMLTPFLKMPFYQSVAFINRVQDQIDAQVENFTPTVDPSVGPGEADEGTQSSS